jgi:hypothetical protein
MSRARFVSPSAILFLTVACLTSARAQVTQAAPGVFTQQYNNARTGNNTLEKNLTPANVNTAGFGKLFSASVDGQVYAQPLWVQNVQIPGQGAHNVVYIATEMDSVFAFDANTGVTLWADNFTDPGENITAVPCEVDGGEQISCAIYPYYGITGTPVIDPTTQTMYLIARTWNTITQVAYQALHAIDITTGAEKFGGPVQIQGSVSGTGAGSVNGVITFNPLADVQRPGLLLVPNNQTGLPPVQTKTVYIGWSGAGHGWMMAYDAATLEQTAIFNTTPNGIRGGVWQSGNGLAADTLGNIYASTGDGPFDANTGGPDYGDSLLKMNGNLDIIDYFTPMEELCRYENDFDLSASGPIIVPMQGGTYPDELIESGKGGNPCDPGSASPIYVVNRDNMGKFNSSADNVVQEIPGAPIGYWSSPTYWKEGSQAAIYYAGQAAPAGGGDYLKMYTLTNGELSSAPVSQSSNVFPIGATPSSSGYGTTNGIIWATLRQEALGLQPGQLPAILYAYNATNVANMLYSSSQNATRDTGGCANKFQVPVVANGKVYVGTQNTLDVFGLIGNPPAAPAVGLSSPCYTFNKQTVGTTSSPRFLVVTNIGSASMTLGTPYVRGMNMSDYTETSTCPTTLAPNASCTIKITFTPSAVGPRIAQIMIPDNAAGNPHNTTVTGLGEAAANRKSSRPSGN